LRAGSLRIGLLLALSLAALGAAGVLLGWLLFDAERVRAQLEVRLGDALGMEVRIGQPASFGLLRGASVTLADLQVSTGGKVVATVERARVRVALLSLLAGPLRPLELHLDRPVFSIERIRPGVFNVYPRETNAGPLDDLSLRRVRLSGAGLSYRDRASGTAWLFERCELDLRAVLQGDVSGQASATIATEGEAVCERLSQAQFAISQVSIEIRSGNEGLVLRVLDGKAFEGRLTARMDVDFSERPPALTLSSRLARFEIAAFMAMLGTEQAATGTMDLDLALAARGTTWQQIRDSAAGTVNLEAGELVLAGFDLDVELDGYAATQRFNLVDVGAVFLAGPFGLAASRGYAFSGLRNGSGGSTRIMELVSNWSVEGGVAQARDAAFRTRENRLALRGGLDFSRYRFRDLQVAVVDRDGCAIVEQMITGPFHAPEVKRPHVLSAAVGPLLNLVKRGVKAFGRQDCDVFYRGVIGHPRAP